MSPLSIVFPAVLLLGAITAVIGARGQLRRNHLFGIRIPSAMRSDRAWAAAHRASIIPTWVGFVVTAILGLSDWFAPSSWYVPLKIALVVVFIATIAVMLVAANRAARAPA